MLIEAANAALPNARPWMAGQGYPKPARFAMNGSSFVIEAGTRHCRAVCRTPGRAATE
ncbi:MAG TPA: hypothetical protein VGE88_11280 [Lysobacter sp.]